MRTFGLTGGIGMGKSTASAFLASQGIAVVDSDVLAREVVGPGTPGLAEVVEEFGSGVLGEDGTIRREELARIVFADPARRKRLEAITHPRIRQGWQAALNQWRAEGRSQAVAVIPLLFETGAETHFDSTICVFCSAKTQRDRLQERGLTDQQIEERLRAQMPIQEKVTRATYAVWTEGFVATTNAQLLRIFAL